MDDESHNASLSDHPMLSTFNAEDGSGGSDKPQGAGEEGNQKESESNRHAEADNGASSLVKIEPFGIF